MNYEIGVNIFNCRLILIKHNRSTFCNVAYDDMTRQKSLSMAFLLKPTEQQMQVKCARRISLHH